MTVSTDTKARETETSEKSENNVMTWTEAQSAAIESRGRTVLVCAAAGSGKTATLTERIIRRLTDPDSPADISRMVVVTFTRNAASELKEKIYKALTKKLAERPGDRALSLALMQLPSARISTIHSFCFDIVKRNAAALGLPMSVKIGDSAECEIRAAAIMEQVVCDYYDREAKDGGRYDFAMLAESLTTTKGESTLAGIFLSLYKKLCAYPGGADNLHRLSGDYEAVMGGDFLDTAYGAVYRKKTAGLVGGILEKYRKLKGRIEDEDRSHPYLAALISDIEVFERVEAAIDRGYTDVAKAVGDIFFCDLKSMKSDLATPTSNLVKELRAKTKKDAETLRTMYSYTQSQLDDAASKTATLSRTLACILCEFEERFRRDKLDAGILDYNDLEYYAMRALYDGEERTDAAREIEALTDEIYIDEYQDVNEVQDRIFAAVSNGKNLFMVGDVKQSIYSFRGGEPSIFTSRRDSYDKYTENTDGDTPCSIFMQNNFRCDSTVVDYVNSIFACLLGKANGRFRYIEEDALKYSKDKGVVSEHEVRPRFILCEDADTNENKKFDPEAAFVAEEIVRLLSGGYKNNNERIRPSDIAVLLRSDSKSGPVYKRELERRGVPVVCSEKVSPFESPELELVMCMLNTIDNPHRDVYLCGVLLSELYGVTLDEIIRVRREYSDAISLYDSVCRYTEQYGWEKGALFIEQNNKYRREAKKLPVDRLIWNIYLETGLLRAAVDRYSNVYQRRRAKRNCMLIYDYARSFESGAFRGLYSFIRYLEGIIALDSFPDAGADASEDCVRIMSMHASKGLEFPVCFVSQTGKRFNKMDQSERLLFDPEIGIGFKFRGDDGFTVVDTPFRQAIKMYKDGLSCEEEMRILYVALTRAREKLYITAKPQKRSSGDSMLEAARYNADMFCSDTVSRLSNFATGILMAHMTEDIDVECERVFVCEKTPPTVLTLDSISDTEDTADDSESGRILDILRARLGYTYPHSALTRMKAKLSVSKLYPAVLDDAEENSGQERIEQLDFSHRPGFLSGEKKATAADRGTATHLIMQFADFENIERSGLASELERLSENGYIEQRVIKEAKLGDIERFMQSAFYRRIRAADKLWREFRFNLRLDAELFSENEALRTELSGEKLLVQGVIDGFFIEGENIVLFDYKTDYLTEYELSHPEQAEKKLTDRHAQQLCYYRMALERIFSKKVSEVYIYSLPLGREVRVDVDDGVLRRVNTET